MTHIDDGNMRNGFNWRSGNLDSSVIIDLKLQHVRKRNPLLYRASIFTEDGARAEYSNRDMILPNELNLRLNRSSPPVHIMWSASEGFDETRFNVSERMQELAEEYERILEQDQEATDSTAGHQRRARTARADAGTLLPHPTVMEPRRPQRQARQRSVAVVDNPSDIDGTRSEELTSSERSGSRSSDSSPSDGSQCSDSPGMARQTRNGSVVDLSDSGEEGDRGESGSSDSESSSSSSSSSSSDESVRPSQQHGQRSRRGRSPIQTRRRPQIVSTPEYSFSENSE